VDLLLCRTHRFFLSVAETIANTRCTHTLSRLDEQWEARPAEGHRTQYYPGSRYSLTLLMWLTHDKPTCVCMQLKFADDENITARCRDSDGTCW